MRQLKRASDLTREFLKDAEYRSPYEEIASEEKIIKHKRSIEDAKQLIDSVLIAPALIEAMKQTQKLS